MTHVANNYDASFFTHPSGKALGWQTDGPQFDSASALLCLQQGCGLWTPSGDFVPHN